MHDVNNLDDLSLAIAHQIHAAPEAQAALGGGAPPSPHALAAQIRPALTPDVVAMLAPEGGAGIFGGGGGAGGAKKPFNFGKFVENINKILPLVITLIGVFGGPKIPPITLPVPPTTNPAPAGA